LLADEATEPQYRETRVYLVLPPEAKDWAVREGLPQPPVGAQIVGGRNVLARLLSPDPYTVFRLTPLLPEADQRIRLTIAVPTDTTSVTYWLDDQVLTTTVASPFDSWWAIQPGEHALYAVVTRDDGSTITTEPIRFRVGVWIPPDERPTSGAAE
jgi:hypothetical protein